MCVQLDAVERFIFETCDRRLAYRSKSLKGEGASRYGGRRSERSILFLARIPKVYQHFRPLRSLKLQACLGFAADRQMRHLGPGQNKTSWSLSRLLSEKGFGHSNAG